VTYLPGLQTMASPTACQEVNLLPTTTIKYFAWSHLPAHLQAVSRPFGELAEKMETETPDGPEKSAGMRKLLEAKDCFVHASLE
jgi:hypothetical protein